MKMVKLREGTTPVPVEPPPSFGGFLIFALLLKTFFNTVFVNPFRTRLGPAWGFKLGVCWELFLCFWTLKLRSRLEVAFRSIFVFDFWKKIDFCIRSPNPKIGIRV